MRKFMSGYSENNVRSVGYAIKMDIEGAETMDILGLIFASISLGGLLMDTFGVE